MRKSKKLITIIATGIILFIWIVLISRYVYIENNQPKETLLNYIECLNNKEYENMYNMISVQSKAEFDKETFISRNKNIYEGIHAKDIKINIEEIIKKNDMVTIKYENIMDTICGKMKFENSVELNKEYDKGYVINWNSNCIFPELNDSDKLMVDTLRAKRGDILDRNNEKLATDGYILNVGIVPGEIKKNNKNSINEIASILEMDHDYIQNKLNQSYVKDDMFIPVKLISKDDKRAQLLSKIKGVMIKEEEGRIYPYGMKCAHLTGYVQNISSEELENNNDNGYDSNLEIGKSGLEKIYEEKLHGINGYDIYIETKDHIKKKSLSYTPQINGKDLKLTIDIKLQETMYEELRQDNGASVILNPANGEVLALVSTPSYDPNDFILGLSKEKWDTINSGKNKPLFNRFQATFAPGSCFKPFTALIGLDTKKLDSNKDRSIKGISWQKDSSWGNYYITRVKEYEGKNNLLNALIYSDNIYFGQIALEIGKDDFKKRLNEFGIGEKIKFEYPLFNSQISSNNEFNTEVQLADSGYGQGEILMNPVQLASMYTLFYNDGNILNPCLIYNDNNKGAIWKKNVTSKENAHMVLNDLVQVVENINGTGHEVYTKGKKIAGKTGTAEIKNSQKDNMGTELGWFIGMTVNDDKNNNIIVLTMIEDVKEKGSSHYVVPKARKVLNMVENN
ncbi:penicillin-binding transpeptidase domain-containing protein [Clostridium neonatale]|uniref:Beta-lactam-inducible penicillin-binding protein n=4 Tax=Clostridium neonatale TaxID=137838 RepID=A0A653ARD9_9CLOT|nr:penicillin-binding transpeptidase domain-containing protein [Clostridium neonatale]MBP8312458.1 penicillin-binding transpeptidase domain-containing protein [Clostridium neonatale]CAI3543495.1 Penicillin-binding protein 3 [Clostridium neonatale]CAI3553703.1 Penicillin-binding protein 3 [Clostridium neonatale]CAI3579266.1 Penicillin-binding protein 3 [Clostridium neonatale]CAI3599158.1 Penicillin-binding protein 3 [Clostridium neonatale]